MHGHVSKFPGLITIRSSAVTAACLVASVLAAGCNQRSPSSGDDGGESAKVRLVMIPKGVTTTFWNAVHQGAKQAADERGVELIWKGPVRDNDRTSQKQVVQQFTNAGVAGLLLAATDRKALAPEVSTAMAKGIPVLIFDSAVDGEQGKDFISYVATDNRAAGRMGGKHVMELTGKGANVVLFRHMEGHDSTTNREEGALEEFKAAGAKILEDSRYSGETTAEAQSTALNMIDVLRQADGIFAPNQSASEGLLLALRQRNLAGKIKIVGFDSSPLLVEGLRSGHLHALVVQDPVKMAATSVNLMVDHLQGKPIEPLVNMDAQLATKENMDSPEIKRLLD